MTRRIEYSILTAICMAGAASIFVNCALTSKAELVNVRYFSPEQIRVTDDSSTPTATVPPPLEVTLGRVSSGPNLRERIAFRDNAYELGYYEDLRWTERPETFVRRELTRALFETKKLKRVLSGSAPILDIELIGFEDLRRNGNREVRIQLKFMLYQDNDVLLERTLSIDRPVPGASPQIEDVVATMAVALETMALQVALQVEKALLEKQPSPHPSSPLP